MPPGGEQGVRHLGETVASGTRVYFHYLTWPRTVRNQAQIIPVGTPTSSASPPSSLVAVHSVLFSASGTYQFRNAYHSGMTGQVVVP